MVLDYLVPAQRTTIEQKVANSRFVTTISPVFSVDEAKDFIKEIRATYPDASHNVPVYQVGFGPSIIAHSSDDGEPSGTAGRPALAVLQGSGLGDSALVITRYFGGTKLGTGGLVKAYSGAARSAIEAVPKARKILVSKAELIIDYPNYERLARLLRENKASNLNEEFTEKVQIQFTIPVEQIQDLEMQISELFHGSLSIKYLEENKAALIPVDC